MGCKTRRRSSSRRARASRSKACASSVNDLECGLTPNGAALCKWKLTFGVRDDQSSTFQWTYSDVGEAGQIECTGAAMNTSPRTIDATFDALSQRLVWDGQTYVPAN